MGTVLEPRDRRLEVRLTAEEFAALRETARDTGISMSDIVRLNLRAGHTDDSEADDVRATS